jgi:hypothetical protein
MAHTASGPPSVPEARLGPPEQPSYLLHVECGLPVSGHGHDGRNWEVMTAPWPRIKLRRHPAANINDTLLFVRLWAICARIRRCLRIKYAKRHGDLCRGVGRSNAVAPGCCRSGDWPALRQARLPHPIPAPAHLYIPRCGRARSRILNTPLSASHGVYGI